MTQDYGAAQPIADWVNTHVYQPAQRVLGAIDKTTPTSPSSNQTNWKPQPNAEQQKEIDRNNQKPKTTPSTPKYHQGTDYVPKTGPAILKKGEAVLNEKDADKYRATKGKDMAKSTSSSRAHSVLGGHSKPKSKGKHPHHITIRHGKSGGHVVTHHFEPDETGSMPPEEEHVMPDKASLMAHLDSNIPDTPAPMAAPPDASAAAGPAAAAAGPAVAPPGM